AKTPDKYTAATLLFADRPLAFRAGSLTGETKVVRVVEPRVVLATGATACLLLAFLAFVLLRVRFLANHAAGEMTLALQGALIRSEGLANQVPAGIIALDAAARS